jgi:hypothetical protein
MGIVDTPLLPRHQKNSTGAAIAATPQQEITLCLRPSGSINTATSTS